MNYKTKFKVKEEKSSHTLFLLAMKKFVLVVGCVILSLILLLVLGGVGCVVYYKSSIGPVSDSDEAISFTINQGDNYYTIADKLKEEGLIKSPFTYKIYLRLNRPTELGIGVYTLKPNMGVKGIVETLSGNEKETTDTVITFVEGKNMRSIAGTIAQNTNNSTDDVYALLKDEDYLKELIDTYWFIDDSVLNKDIYYSLEGYLYPNTYNFLNKDVTVKEIFKKMLDEMERELQPYENDFKKSKYSVHEILTLASIVELEANTEIDRNRVSGVFLNRLKAKMPLGSDVTTYYGIGVDMAERDLYNSEINTVNAYNTRPSAMAGKLPVGPICNPSIISIAAVLRPITSDYYYFVSDKNGKMYYSKDANEHNQTVKELKDKGLWYQYTK